MKNLAALVRLFREFPNIPRETIEDLYESTGYDEETAVEILRSSTSDNQVPEEHVRLWNENIGTIKIPQTEFYRVFHKWRPIFPAQVILNACCAIDDVQLITESLEGQNANDEELRTSGSVRSRSSNLSASGSTSNSNSQRNLGASSSSSSHARPVPPPYVPPGPSGVPALERLRQEFPLTNVVMLRSVLEQSNGDYSDAARIVRSQFQIEQQQQQSTDPFERLMHDFPSSDVDVLLSVLEVADGDYNTAAQMLRDQSSAAQQQLRQQQQQQQQQQQLQQNQTNTSNDNRNHNTAQQQQQQQQQQQPVQPQTPMSYAVTMAKLRLMFPTLQPRVISSSYFICGLNYDNTVDHLKLIVANECENEEKIRLEAADTLAAENLETGGSSRSSSSNNTPRDNIPITMPGTATDQSDPAATGTQSLARYVGTVPIRKTEELGNTTNRYGALANPGQSRQSAPSWASSSQSSMSGSFSPGNSGMSHLGASTMSTNLGISGADAHSTTATTAMSRIQMLKESQLAVLADLFPYITQSSLEKCLELNHFGFLETVEYILQHQSPTEKSIAAAAAAKAASTATVTSSPSAAAGKKPSGKQPVGPRPEPGTMLQPDGMSYEDAIAVALASSEIADHSHEPHGISAETLEHFNRIVEEFFKRNPDYHQCTREEMMGIFTDPNLGNGDLEQFMKFMLENLDADLFSIQIILAEDAARDPEDCNEKIPGEIILRDKSDYLIKLGSKPPKKPKSRPSSNPASTEVSDNDNDNDGFNGGKDGKNSKIFDDEAMASSWIMVAKKNREFQLEYFKETEKPIMSRQHNDFVDFVCELLRDNNHAEALQYLGKGRYTDAGRVRVSVKIFLEHNLSRATEPQIDLHGLYVRDASTILLLRLRLIVQRRLLFKYNCSATELASLSSAQQQRMQLQQNKSVPGMTLGKAAGGVEIDSSYVNVSTGSSYVNVAKSGASDSAVGVVTAPTALPWSAASSAERQPLISLFARIETLLRESGDCAMYESVLGDDRFIMSVLQGLPQDIVEIVKKRNLSISRSENRRMQLIFDDTGLCDFSAERMVIKIITGAGLHSKDSKGRIKPQVHNLLKHLDIPFKEENHGCVAIKF